MGYTVADLHADLTAVLQSRPEGPLSGKALGDVTKVALWTPAVTARLYEGLVAANKLFFPKLGLRDLSRLLVAEGAQESTGDYRLGVVPVRMDDFRSQGFLQATPGNVLKDFAAFGVQFDPDMDPKAVTSWNLADPKIQVLTFSWYCLNSVAAGVSLQEYAHRVMWNTRGVGEVTCDYGNLQYTWLSGPRHDRHKSDKEYRDYHDRIADYFVCAKFGSFDDFERLLRTPTSKTFVKCDVGK